MIRYRPLLALALVACGSGAERRFALGTQPAQNLVGIWDASLSLAQSYKLGLHEPAATRICGTIGFVANRYPVGGSDQMGDAKQVGIYDLDLSRMGLNWLGDNSFPTAVATPAGNLNARAGADSDSVAIVLNPGSQERIVLLGRSSGGGIRGRWTAQSSRGIESGSFALTPHANAGNQPPACSEFD